MVDDGDITAAQKEQALAAPPKLIPFVRPRRDGGFHFVDYLAREAKSAGIDNLTAASYTVHSTIDATLQRDTEAALQEGLARYEISSGRMHFPGAEANIADAVAKISEPQCRRRVRAGAAAEAAATPSRPPGNRRCVRCGCRSTTCSGRRRWCWTNPAKQATATFTSASPTAAFCRLTTYGGEINAASVFTT